MRSLCTATEEEPLLTKTRESLHATRKTQLENIYIRRKEKKKNPSLLYKPRLLQEALQSSSAFLDLPSSMFAFIDSHPTLLLLGHMP